MEHKGYLAALGVIKQIIGIQKISNICIGMWQIEATRYADEELNKHKFSTLKADGHGVSIYATGNTYDGQISSLSAALSCIDVGLGMI